MIWKINTAKKMSFKIEFTRVSISISIKRRNFQQRIIITHHTENGSIVKCEKCGWRRRAGLKFRDEQARIFVAFVIITITSFPLTPNAHFSPQHTKLSHSTAAAASFTSHFHHKHSTARGWDESRGNSLYCCLCYHSFETEFHRFFFQCVATIKPSRKKRRI